jgi:hypothetical protein
MLRTRSFPWSYWENNNDDQELKMTDQKLMILLRFDESDLLLNKKGQISEKQKQRLRLMETGSKAGALFLGSIMILSALIGVGLGTAAGFGWIGAGFGPAFRIIMISVFGCFWTLIWGGAGFLIIRRAFARVKTEAKQVEGQVHIVKVSRQIYNSENSITTDHTVFELRVGGRAFEIHPDLATVMIHGDLYAIYFASFNLKGKPNEILSAEWLAPASAAPVPQPISLADSEVVEWVKNGNVLEAIRVHRKIHGSNYEDAKAAIFDVQLRIGSGK